MGRIIPYIMENKTCLNWNHQPNMVFYGTYLMIIAEMIDWIIPSGVLKHGNGTSTIDIYSWGNHLSSMSRGFAMGCPIFSYDSPKYVLSIFQQMKSQKAIDDLKDQSQPAAMFPCDVGMVTSTTLMLLVTAMFSLWWLAKSKFAWAIHPRYNPIRNLQCW